MEEDITDEIDLYSSIHKGQRSRFVKISMQAGIIDHSDKSSLDKLYEELCGFREHMRLHALMEEKFIHPLLSDRVPGGARKLEEDHQLIHRQFNDLVAYFDGIRTKPNEFEKNLTLPWNSTEPGTDF